jgi:hypothetical protein
MKKVFIFVCLSIQLAHAQHFFSLDEYMKSIPGIGAANSKAIASLAYCDCSKITDSIPKSCITLKDLHFTRFRTNKEDANVSALIIGQEKASVASALESGELYDWKSIVVGKDKLEIPATDLRMQYIKPKWYQDNSVLIFCGRNRGIIPSCKDSTQVFEAKAEKIGDAENKAFYNQPGGLKKLCYSLKPTPRQQSKPLRGSGSGVAR